MSKGSGVFLLMITVFQPLFSQEIITNHTIQRKASNEYFVKSTITGLVGVDIARITYFIPKEHICKPSENNSFFSKREEKFIKFFIMEVPTIGIIDIELGVLLNGEGRFDFPIEFQYSKNEEKKVINLPSVVIEIQLDLVAEDNKKAEEEKMAEAAAKAEILAKNAEEERIVKEKAAAELQAKTAEEKIVKEQAEAKRRLEEERVLKEKIAAKKLEADAIVTNEKPVVVIEKTVIEPVIKIRYAVQILALSQFSEKKLIDFCKRNNLSMEQISKEQVNGITKIRYGSLGSMEEAEQLRKKMTTKSQINGAFVVKINSTQ